MPARRELHTGRYNFLHRSWGPLEPFDDSMPEILKQHGIHSHLATDHYHYFEDGGATYHTRYETYEFFRGQEGDAWKAVVNEPTIPEAFLKSKNLRYYEWVNRKFMDIEEKQPQPQTFNQGLDFIRTNYQQEHWFLHIETFDPHEPFFTQQHYKDLYPHDYKGPLFDWPPYREVTETPEQVAHMRYEYAALISMCDVYLGKVLDIMDELDLWQDTMLIVNTDHGFLLGEHGWWAKSRMPFYNEIVHIPLFIWDPRSKKAGERRQSLVQTIDLPATLLEYFNVERPKDMQGIALRETIESDKQIREAALFGIHGGHVNCTDGRYVYMRAPQEPQNKPLYEYTLMPTIHGAGRAFMPLDNFNCIEIQAPFTFTKGCQMMKLEGRGEKNRPFRFPTMLFDLELDPKQENPINNRSIEHRMISLMKQIMLENDSPPEQFERLGI
jgi:arylsulfatase A-like enzyme